MRYGTVHTGKKKFVLINRESVLPTKCKSFENALLWLTEPDA